MRTVEAPPATPLRAGMVTTWNQRCGVAEYSRHLIEGMPGGEARWTILAPEDATPLGPDGGDVVRCWRDRWPLDLTRVIAEAERRDLSLVHFQTHLTMWGAGEGAALTRLRAGGRHVFMTLHSVRGARPGPDAVAALRAVDRIFVHTDTDRERLAARGLADNVTVLPHGFLAAPAPDGGEVRPALGLTGGPVIGTFGFLRPHKGLAELIEAVAILRRRHPDAFLLALTSLYPSDESTAYHQRCLAVLDRLGLRDRCRIVTGFLDYEECVRRLRACDVIALPYRPTIDSVSGAVRTVLESGAPVLATASPAFDDVADLVLRVGRVAPRAIARGLCTLLDDRARADELVARARRRIARDAWPVVGRMYAKFVRAAVTDLTALARPYPIAAGSPE
jgi:glycosyltransferase involved in cell wall biosynthesis